MIHINNKAHGAAIAAEAGAEFNRDYDTVISRTRGDKLLGGVIYSNFTRESISVHMAGFDPYWVNRDMLWMAFHYPYVQLKVNRMFGFVKSNNTKALDLDLRLGFKEVARIPGVYPYADMVVLAMEREECRWISLEPKGVTSGLLQT